MRHRGAILFLWGALLAAGCGGKAISADHVGVDAGATHEPDAGSHPDATTAVDTGGAGGSGGSTHPVDTGGAGGSSGSTHPAERVGSGGAKANPAATDLEAAACKHVFTALHVPRCGGAGLEPSEAERQLDVFQSNCVAQFAAPGNGVTPALLEACAAAYERSDCYGGPPAECEFHGFLEAGEPCFMDAQCKGGRCDNDKDTPGGLIPFYCGTCSRYGEVGAVCDNACVAGARCMRPANSTDVEGAPRCVPTHLGVPGDACDGMGNLCSAGYFCNRKTNTCAPLRGQGESCDMGHGSPGCVAPTYCDYGRSVCTARTHQGDPCSDGACEPGFVCDVLGTGTCVSPGWQEPGASCDARLHPCRFGDCWLGRFNVETEGTCPSRVNEGGACDDMTHVCDVGEVCYSGICTNQYAVVCQTSR